MQLSIHYRKVFGYCDRVAYLPFPNSDTISDLYCKYLRRPVIEDAIRRAALERRVRVRLLFSDWDHTKVCMYRVEQKKWR